MHCLGLFLFLFSLPLSLWSCAPEPIETDLLLPVEFANIPDNMVLTEFHTGQIEIRVKGDPRHIEQIQTKTIHYPADLYTDLEFDPAGDSNSIEPGRFLLPVDKTRIPLNPALTILGISPSFLGVRLDRKISQTFKVTVPTIGEPAKGHLALEPACEPSSVTLTGAQSLLKKITQLKTKPVDLNHANESFKKEVPLDLENPGLFSSSRSMFIVTIPIQEESGERTLTDIPVMARNATGRVKIEPEHISVNIKGPVDTLGKKSVIEQVHAFMDLSGLKPGVYARHAYIEIPVDLVMIQAVPQVFTVKIEPPSAKPER